MRFLRFFILILIPLTTALTIANTEDQVQQGKVDICHVPPGNPDNVQLISVNQNAVDTHMAHGDYFPTNGSCTGAPPPTEPPPGETEEPTEPPPGETEEPTDEPGKPKPPKPKHTNTPPPGPPPPPPPSPQVCSASGFWNWNNEYPDPNAHPFFGYDPGSDVSFWTFPIGDTTPAGQVLAYSADGSQYIVITYGFGGANCSVSGPSSLAPINTCSVIGNYATPDFSVDGKYNTATNTTTWQFPRDSFPSGGFAIGYNWVSNTFITLNFGPSGENCWIGGPEPIDAPEAKQVDTAALSFALASPPIAAADTCELPNPIESYYHHLTHLDINRPTTEALNPYIPPDGHDVDGWFFRHNHDDSINSACEPLTTQKVAYCHNLDGGGEKAHLTDASSIIQGGGGHHVHIGSVQDVIPPFWYIGDEGLSYFEGIGTGPDGSWNPFNDPENIANCGDRYFITLDKQWQDHNSDPLTEWPDDYSVTIDAESFEGSDHLDGVSCTTVDGDTYTCEVFPDGAIQTPWFDPTLPRIAVKGGETYTVDETVTGGCYVEVDGDSNNSLDGTGTFEAPKNDTPYTHIVTNRLCSGEVQIDKTWVGGGWPASDITVTVELYVDGMIFDTVTFSESDQGTKTITGIPDGADIYAVETVTDANDEICFSDAGSTFTGLTPASSTIPTDTMPYEVDLPDSGDGTLIATFSYVNEPCGNLVLVKEIQGELPDNSLNTFSQFGPSVSGITMDLDGQTVGWQPPPSVGPGSDSQTLKLNVGTYDISESIDTAIYTTDGWTCVDETNATVASSTTASVTSVPVTFDGTTTCTIINKVIPKLTIEKVINRFGDDTTDLSAFGPVVDSPVDPEPTDTWMGTGNSDTVVYTEPGDYSFYETLVDGYAASTWDCASNSTDVTPDAGIMTTAGADGQSDNVSLTLSPGDDITCTITNNRLPMLTLVKDLPEPRFGDTTPHSAFGPFIDSGPATVDLWSAPISGTESEVPVTLTDAGTVVFYEATQPGYTAGTWSCTGTGFVGTDLASANIGTGTEGASLVLEYGDDITCEITNTADIPTLTIKKIIDERYGDTTTYQAFGPIVSGPEDPGSWANISTGTTSEVSVNTIGTYNISEVDPATLDYSTTGWRCVDNNLAPDDEDYVVASSTTHTLGDVSLALGDNITCEITNTADIPILTIKKIIDERYGDTTPLSSFGPNVTGPVGTPSQAWSSDSSVDMDSVEYNLVGSYTISEVDPAT